MMDANRNGVPDYKEGWFWKAAGSVVSFAVRLFIPKHTVAYKASEFYEKALKDGASPDELARILSNLKFK